MPPRTTRTQRSRPLHPGRIIAAAVALADREGVAAVTMRRVADELGCEAMSLYNHVPDKGALIAGMAGQVAGEVVRAAAAVPDSTDWRDCVRDRCLAARQVMQRHGWAPAILAVAPEAPPEVYPLFEQLVATLVAADASYALAHRAIHALGSMVLGFSTELFDPPAPAAEPSPELLAELAGSMPHLAHLAAMELHEESGSLSTCDTDAEFRFTLDLVLDGLDAQLRGIPLTAR